MRALIQRVNKATVEVEKNVTGEISSGLLVFIGFEETDSEEDLNRLTNKIINLRIFNDDHDKMNFSVKDLDGEVLIVSQFTLHAQTKKGNRPSYNKAAPPELANQLYNQFVDSFKIQSNLKVATGRFGADMKVTLENDGPVTIWIDTKNKE